MSLMPGIYGVGRLLGATLILLVVASLSGKPALGSDPPASAASPSPLPAPRYPHLRQELLGMVKADQEVRERWRLHPQDGQAGAAVGAEDRKNRARLQAIVLAHGWPGYDLVGVDGAHAAWLLVQHQDADRPFQRLCLERLGKAVARHDASPTDLAYLTDRVLVAEGRKQRYGTQFRQGPGGDLAPSPIEDPARVDERRRDAGLPSMEEYTRRLREIYGKPPVPAPGR